MKINYDYWWLARQHWIDSMQTKPGAEIRDVVRIVVLGILLTACLIVWHYGMGRGRMKVIIRQQVYRPNPFGGTTNTTLCGRMQLQEDGMNSGRGNEVTCKLCLKRLEQQRRRSA